MMELACLNTHDIAGREHDELNETIAYPFSGEISFHSPNLSAALETAPRHVPAQNPLINDTNGLSLEVAQWRFNLRGSNTEPLLRLNVETRQDHQALQRHAVAIETLINLGSR
jgi:phosphomannomutase